MPVRVHVRVCGCVCPRVRERERKADQSERWLLVRAQTANWLRTAKNNQTAAQDKVSCAFPIVQEATQPKQITERSSCTDKSRWITCTTACWPWKNQCARNTADYETQTTSSKHPNRPARMKSCTVAASGCQARQETTPK